MPELWKHWRAVRTASITSIWREQTPCADCSGGNKEKLRGVDKAYYARVRGSGGYQPGFYLRGGDRFLKLPALEPAFPQPLFRGRPFTFPLFIGDDLSQPEVRKRVPSVSLRFAASAPAGTRFPMEVNEHHYTAEADGDNWVLRLPPEAIRKGKNHINRRRTAGRQLRLENGTDFIRKGSAAPFRTR